MLIDSFCVNGSWTVDYPLFLLRGTFLCHSGCHPTAVTKSKSIFFKTPSKIVPEIFFKTLISLDTGSNDASVCCPHISYNFRINRVPTDDTRPYVRCVYVVFSGHDGSFQAPPNVPSDSGSACRRLGLAVRLLQTLTAETIFAETGCRRTFVCAGDLSASSRLQPRVDASPVSAAVWCIQSRISFQEAQNLPPLRLWECLARELDVIFWEDRGRAKWLALASCTEFRPMTSFKMMPTSYEEELVAWHLSDRVRCTHGQKASRRLVHVCQIHQRLTGGSISTIVDIGIQGNIFEDFYPSGTYWANYTTALGTMLHELGHCFDLDHNFEGIMRRGGDDLNLVQNEYSFRRLSIFQFIGVTFYENVLQVTENAQNQSEIFWGRCESIGNCGGAFWRKEVAQFLSFHRWFIESPKPMEGCETVLKDGILKSPAGIRLLQVRISEDISSPNLTKLWNLTRHSSAPELPLDASLMQGCIVYHKLFGESQKRLPITKILHNAFSRLKVPTLKVAVLDSNGYVFQKTISNDCLKR
uniref:Zinc metalloproteinase YIL108W n=1 Tax=Echinococcus granulosus TaxID=6210 RepID=A0A068WT76_ECHGR|nr:zinc metalloproteinase YIL108W [Echinococcus granulosus]